MLTSYRQGIVPMFLYMMITLLWPHAVVAVPNEFAVPDTMSSAFGLDEPAVTISRALFVYVTFPGEMPGESYPPIAWRDSITSAFGNYWYNQSNGDIDLDVSIVSNPTRPDGLWVADYTDSSYRDSTSVAAIARYEDTWIDPYENNVQYQGELQAEILYKVYEAHVGLPNPFEGVSAVVFVYHGDSLGIGRGYGYNCVDFRQFPFLAVMNEDLVHLPQVYGTLPGCQFEDYNEGDSSLESLWSHMWRATHEMGHYFGYLHTESEACYHINRTDHYILHEEAYFYGPYCNMSWVQPLGIGSMPLLPLQLLARGWLDVSYVESDTLGLVLPDIRLQKKIVGIPIPNTVVGYQAVPVQSEQFFYLAYHGGNGMDIGLKENGDTLYLSRGVAIWHALAGTRYVDTGEVASSATWDLESAWGRFSDPDTTSPGMGAWLIEDTESGYDNLDIWYDLCGVNHGWPNDFSGLYDYFYNNPGSEYDFFGAMSGKTEFSYRSNPNTLGRQLDLYGRRSPQNVLNSLIIDVVEESGVSATINIRFAPRESVITPVGESVIIVGDSCEVSWSTEYTIDQPGGIIDTVDIYFSPGFGLSDVLIASGIDATAGSYTWIPGPEHVSDTAKIKVVCHNVNDASHTGTDESDDYFVVVAPPVARFTNVSAGTQLYYPGQPTCAIGYDAGTDALKDLFVGVEPGGAQSYAFQQTGLGSGGVPEFAFNSLFFPQAGARAVVAGDYDNDGDLDLLVTSAGGVEVYRIDSGGTYTEVSSDLGLALLTDKATAAVWGDYDNDGWLDLYVVRTGGYTDPPTFPNVFGEQHKLFRNKIAFGGNPPFGQGFVDVTDDAGLAGVAAVGSVSASFIDYDRDGDLDLFVANLQPPPAGVGGVHSLLFVNQGDGTFNEEYESRFSGAIYYATAHKWSDVDNDGDFDLVLTTHEYKPEIHFNDGFGGFASDPVKRLDADEGHAGLEVFDQDLDGWSDIFCVSQDALYSNRFFTGVGTIAGVDYVETTGSVGMSSASEAMGSAVADFTRDGDLDLFLGKPVASGEYFYITDNQSGGEWIGRDYVKVRLDSPYGANNRAGLGAVIEVTDGTRTWVRSVDGGSGRGGQDDRDLIFGLGQVTGTLTATVWWPDGHYLAGIPLTKSNEALGETLNLITDDVPALVNIDATRVINPVTGTLDWSFSWDSHFASDPAQDVLAFDQAGIPVPCWPGWPDLTPTTPGVTHSYYQLPNGKFHHQFDVSNVDCVKNCSFRFTVSSFISGTTLTSAPQTKSVKFCPAQF